MRIVFIILLLFSCNQTPKDDNKKELNSINKEVNRILDFYLMKDFDMYSYGAVSKKAKEKAKISEGLYDAMRDFSKTINDCLINDVELDQICFMQKEEEFINNLLLAVNFSTLEDFDKVLLLDLVKSIDDLNFPYNFNDQNNINLEDFLEKEKIKSKIICRYFYNYLSSSA